MPQTFAPLIYFVAFVAVVLAVQVMAGLLFSSRDQTERVNRRLTMLASGMKAGDVYSALVRQPLTGFGGNLFLARLYDRFSIYCRQASLEMAPLRLFMVYGTASIVLWGVSLFALRSDSFLGLVVSSVIALPLCLAICGFGVWLWLARKRSKRLRALEGQMPLALDVITRAIRAGHPVVSAVQLAGQEMGDPIGSEFGLIVDETTYGFEFRDALANFARRAGSQDAHFFAVSVAIQADTGGNLAEVLEGLAAVIRSRASLSKRVKALSSEGRASAILLSALPVLLISGMLLLRPAFYTSKFSDPIFWPVAGTVFGAYLIGLVMIHRIINFKY